MAGAARSPNTSTEFSTILQDKAERDGTRAVDLRVDHRRPHGGWRGRMLIVAGPCFSSRSQRLTKTHEYWTVVQ